MAQTSTEKPERKRLKPIQEQFIIEYVSCGGVKSRAAKKCGVPYITAKMWFKNEEFANAVKEAEDEWYEVLRASLYKRAVEKSDVLGMFFMKARYPEIYDDNYRNKRFQDELIQKVKDSLAPIILEPQAKLDKPLV